MLESRRSYGYGLVSSAGTGYDWVIKKGKYSVSGGRPCKTEAQAMKEAKKFIRECGCWKGAEIEIIPYKAYRGY